MGTLKSEAEAYVPQQKTRNVAELPEVSVNFKLVDDSFEVDEVIDGVKVKKTVNIKVIEVNGERFRVPSSVIEQLQIHLESNPNLEKFKVNASGTGMSTKYTVIPLPL